MEGGLPPHLPEPHWLESLNIPLNMEPPGTQKHQLRKRSWQGGSQKLINVFINSPPLQETKCPIADVYFLLITYFV